MLGLRISVYCIVSLASICTFLSVGWNNKDSCILQSVKIGRVFMVIAISVLYSLKYKYSNAFVGRKAPLHTTAHVQLVCDQLTARIALKVLNQFYVSVYNNADKNAVIQQINSHICLPDAALFVRSPRHVRPVIH